MGTNFYRIPTEAEMLERKDKLTKRLEEMTLSISDISQSFAEDNEDDWGRSTPWDEFMSDVKVHLGKRSSGWKFSWNFNDNKFYSNRQSLLDYILSGRVIDEYGEEIGNEEFIEMALSWGEPDGLVFNEEYEKKQLKKNPKAYIHGPKYWDREIDGLRVSSSTQFS
jgi:hypothetical protein